MARIERLARAALAAGLILCLASCSYVVPLRAVFIDGRLGFVPAPGADLIGDCLFRVTISNAAGETMWEIDRPLAPPRPCPQWLPLLYGQAPAGMETLVAARPLRAGGVYILYGNSDATLTAAFRLRGDGAALRVENLRNGAREVLAARAAAGAWQAEQGRQAFEARERARTRNQAEVIFEDRPLPAEPH
jgi:hypothetical protein